MSLSNPIPQPECGGIPQSYVLRWSANCAGSSPCSVNLALSNSASWSLVPPDDNSSYPYCKSKERDSVASSSFSLM